MAKVSTAKTPKQPFEQINSQQDEDEIILLSKGGTKKNQAQVELVQPKSPSSKLKIGDV